MNRYLIPRRITQRYELFPGWGWPEVLAALAGVALGGLVFGLLSLLNVPLVARLLPALLLAGAVVGIARPMPVTGESALAMLLQARSFFRARQIHLYDIGRDDA